MKSISQLLFLSLSLASLSGQAAQKADIDKTLAAFDSDPVAAMNAPLPKTVVQGEAALDNQFNEKDIADKIYVTKKDFIRKEFSTVVGGIEVKLGSSGRAFEESNDQAENLVDNGSKLLTSLEEMDKDLKSAKLDETPWSDSYWPLYKGNLGWRYTGNDSLGYDNWEETLKILKAPFDLSDITNLSPAEKYDILVGDTKHKSLTNGSWNVGKEYKDQFKKVETWMGICHGWTAASIMQQRPLKTIGVLAADEKTMVKFTPSDIKALASQLWANTRIYDSEKNFAGTRFVGGRCNQKSPKTDAATGRILDQDCFDTNPSTWHKSVVNQIGVNKRSFVLDVTYDYEVWNQPAYSYSYTYFNPKTRKAADTLEEAKVDLKDFTNDKFRKVREASWKKDPHRARVASFVGVSMDFTYVVETNPSHRASDGPEHDAVRSATYTYDLELDADGNIVGGEWYTNAHPDFMWVPAPKTQALTNSDFEIDGDYDTSKAFPSEWTKSAVEAASVPNKPSPLEKVVSALIQKSRE